MRRIRYRVLCLSCANSSGLLPGTKRGGQRSEGHHPELVPRCGWRNYLNENWCSRDGGIGKTVLASLVVREPEIRKNFKDGIYWLFLGQSPNIVNRQIQLAKAVSGKNEQFIDIQDSKAHLRTQLLARQVLVVLDDVWQMTHIAAFNVLNKNSSLLVTTCNSDLMRGISGIEFDLDVLSADQARELLSRWTNQSRFPVQAEDIIKECGNLPLALAMVGAMLRGKESEAEWQEVLELLQDAEIDEIRQAFPDYEHESLLRALQVSVDALDEDLCNSQSIPSRKLTEARFFKTWPLLVCRL